MKRIESVGANPTDWALKHLDFEQKSPRKSNEISHTLEFDTLVSRIKNAMEYDQKKIAMAGDLTGDFEENITEWFSFISIPEDAYVSGLAVGRKDRFRMILGETPLPKPGDENISAESALLGIAVTEAKLEMVRDLVLGTYLEDKINEYISELNIQRDLILFPDGYETPSVRTSVGILMPSNEYGHATLKTQAIFGGLLIGSMILSACATPAQATGPKTEQAKTPTAIVQPTEMPVIVEPTVMPTEVVREIMIDREYVNEEISYKGFNFILTFITADKFQTSILEKDTINEINLNRNNPEAKEKIGELLVYQLIESYNFQNKTNISESEYLANPSQYPVMLKAKDADGNISTQSITLDKISELSLVYTSGKNGELFYKFPGLSTETIGYAYVDGKLTLYRGLKTNDPDIKVNLEYEFADNKRDVPLAISGIIGVNSWLLSLSLMPYSVFYMDEGKTLTDISPSGKLNTTEDVFRLLGLDYSDKTDIEEILNMWERYDLFEVELVG